VTIYLLLAFRIRLPIGVFPFLLMSAFDEEWAGAASLSARFCAHAAVGEQLDTPVMKLEGSRLRGTTAAVPKARRGCCASRPKGGLPSAPILVDEAASDPGSAPEGGQQKGRNRPQRGGVSDGAGAGARLIADGLFPLTSLKFQASPPCLRERKGFGPRP